MKWESKIGQIEDTESCILFHVREYFVLVSQLPKAVGSILVSSWSPGVPPNQKGPLKLSWLINHSFLQGCALTKARICIDLSHPHTNGSVKPFSSSRWWTYYTGDVLFSCCTLLLLCKDAAPMNPRTSRPFCLAGLPEGSLKKSQNKFDIDLCPNLNNHRIRQSVPLCGSLLSSCQGSSTKRKMLDI